MKILTLNSGSSSQKAALFDIKGMVPKGPPLSLWEGEIEWQQGTASVKIKSPGITRKSRIKISSRSQAVEHLLQTLWTGETRVIDSAAEIAVVGHRVVHGGPKYKEPAFITRPVKAAIAGVSAFAPLHNDAELEGMEIAAKLLGRVPQIAVFDTGFHRHMPLAASVYPGPYQWLSQGIRRYGFHGANHHYCALRAAQLLGKKLNSLKLVTCHLGNGCSLAAIRGGRSLDTTMGFTPLEGLMMGTRSGSVDPGILTYLMRQRRLNGEQMDRILNKESGLLGISGVSSDMRTILAARKKGHQRAALAFDMYIHRLRAGIAAMTASLGGIDALVFSAGIGENSPEVRSETCASLSFLGLRLDPRRNMRCSPDQDIAAANSRARIFVIRAREDWMIAQECWKLMRQK